MYVTRLLWGVERKSCWWLAEQAGHARRMRWEQLLRTALRERRDSEPHRARPLPRPRVGGVDEGLAELTTQAQGGADPLRGGVGEAT